MKYYIDFEGGPGALSCFPRQIGACTSSDRCFFSDISRSEMFVNDSEDYKGKTLTCILNDALDLVPYADEVMCRFRCFIKETTDGTEEFYCFGNDVIFLKNIDRLLKDFDNKVFIKYLIDNLNNIQADISVNVVEGNFRVSLQEAVKFYGSEIIQTHNALDDAKLLKWVYEKVTEIREKDVEAPALEDSKRIICYNKSKRLVFYSFEDAAKYVALTIQHQPKMFEDDTSRLTIMNHIKKAAIDKKSYNSLKWGLE